MWVSAVITMAFPRFLSVGNSNSTNQWRRLYIKHQGELQRLSSFFFFHEISGVVLYPFISQEFHVRGKAFPSEINDETITILNLRCVGIFFENWEKCSRKLFLKSKLVELERSAWYYLQIFKSSFVLFVIKACSVRLYSQSSNVTINRPILLCSMKSSFSFAWL